MANRNYHAHLCNLKITMSIIAIQNILKYINDDKPLMVLLRYNIRV